MEPSVHLSESGTKFARRSGERSSGSGSRTRPTNNQLLYRATFQWSHYRNALVGNPTLPSSTEACASVTSAFLQVIGVLFEVEKLRQDQPRNILRLLATNTRRTKVVELSSGTHRVPEELKRHSIGDGVGGNYSTNLDRNRYGIDDQYLATVVRYNLDYLELCPLLVNITILDAKGGNITTCVSAEPGSCRCNPTGLRPPLPADTRQQRLIRTSGPTAEPAPGWFEGGREAWPARREGSRETSTPRSAAPRRTGAASAFEGAEAPEDAGEDAQASPKASVKEEAPPPQQKGPAGNEALFDALLMAAREPNARAPSQTRRKSATQRQSAAKGSDSDDDSAAGDDEAPQAEAGLRRSARRAKRLFNAAAVENGELDGSEGESSMDECENRRGRSRGGARGASGEWEEMHHRGRSSRGQRDGGMPSWTSHTEPRHKAPRGMDNLQHQLQRMKQQYQGASREVQEADEREEGSSDTLVRRLKRTIAEQQAAAQSQEDQIASLRADLAAAKSTPANGSANGAVPAVPDGYLAAMLREAQMTIGRLKQEKAVLSAALANAGIPVPLPQGGGEEHGPLKHTFGEWRGSHLAPMGLGIQAPGSAAVARSLPHPAQPSSSAFTARSIGQSFQVAPPLAFSHSQGMGPPPAHGAQTSANGSLPLANGRTATHSVPSGPLQPIVYPPRMPAPPAMPNGSGPPPAASAAPNGTSGVGFSRPAQVASLPMPLQDVKPSNAPPAAAPTGAVKRKREEEDARAAESSAREGQAQPPKIEPQASEVPTTS